MFTKLTNHPLSRAACETLRCDDCGQFISYKDLINNKARHQLISNDTEYSCEDWITLCKKCNK